MRRLTTAAFALPVIAAVSAVVVLHGRPAALKGHPQRATLPPPLPTARTRPSRPRRAPEDRHRPAPLPRPRLEDVIAEAATRNARSAARRKTLLVMPLGAAFLSLMVASAVLVPFGTTEVVSAVSPRLYEPLPPAALTTAIAVNRAPNAVVVIDFNTPMDRASVESGLTVVPPADVTLAWNSTFTRLSVAPATAWDLRTFYSVSVAAGALDHAGNALARPTRAAFLVESPITARIAATNVEGDRARIDTTITVTFNRPVDLASAAAAFSISPDAEGSFEPSGGTGKVLSFAPTTPLKAGATYTVRLTGTLTDVGGVGLEGPVSATIRTVTAPKPVAFSPPTGSRVEAVKAPLKVVPAKTAKAVVEAPAKKPATTIEKPKPTAEQATKPKVTKPKVTTPKVTKPKTTKPKTTKPATTEPKTPKPEKSIAKPKDSAGSSSWIAVEAYYLSLVNCTRTGGWVSSTGKCTGAGTRKVKPLKLDKGLSAFVARPYAKLLANRGGCTHFMGTSPTTRLRRAGFGSFKWAENLSCPSGMSASDTAIYSIRYFQNEKPWNGGHYRNLMNPVYDRAGIGIWVGNGRVIIVSDFYKG